MDDGFGCISEDYFVDVAEDIKLLHNISTQLRNRRVERGALFFEIPKKVFKLD
jgi:exoribonuclease R